MKRYTFTCVLEGDAENWMTPGRFVDMALEYGDRHQDFVLYAQGDIRVDDLPEEEQG